MKSLSSLLLLFIFLLIGTAVGELIIYGDPSIAVEELQRQENAIRRMGVSPSDPSLIEMIQLREAAEETQKRKKQHQPQPQPQPQPAITK